MQASQAVYRFDEQRIGLQKDNTASRRPKKFEFYKCLCYINSGLAELKSLKAKVLFRLYGLQFPVFINEAF